MKRYIRMIWISLLVLGTGCADWVNVEPENSVTYANYFKTEKDAQGLLFNIQWNLRRLPYQFANWTEFAEEKNGYYSGSYLPLLLRSWGLEYSIIDAADLLIDNAFRFSLTEDELKPYLLQAYFAKAQAYFSIAINWGEAPIIKERENYKKYAKSSTEKVLEEAEKYALLAMELPAYEELKLGNLSLCKQYGNKGATAALLAKLYAWRAGVENKKEYWSKAEEYCTQIILKEVGDYELAKTMEDVCTEVLKGNSKESIWEMFQDTEEKAVFYSAALGMTSSGLIGFPVIITSKPTDYYSYIIKKEQVSALFSKGDLRRKVYFWGIDADSLYIKNVNGAILPDTIRQGGVVISSYDNKESKRAFLYKFRYPHYVRYDWSPEPRWEGMNMNVIRCRLADIFLLRAECRSRQGKKNAVDDLNEIRKRAYGTDAYNFPCQEDVENGLSTDIQLAIYREREKELFLEGHRYYDARRNGVDYVRRLVPAYAKLSEQDIQEGAFYLGVAKEAFVENDLMRQNIYWSKREQ